MATPKKDKTAVVPAVAQPVIVPPVVDVQTPFGKMQSDEGQKKAPTKQEVADWPAQYEGTSFDPVEQVIAAKAVENFATVSEPYTGKMEFKHWFQYDMHGAQAYWKNQHEGHDLRLDRLSDTQMTKLGFKLMTPVEQFAEALAKSLAAKSDK